MPIARKLSLQALSCEIQHEGLNSSLVSARQYLKMAEKKKWYHETYCLLTAALWVFCIPGVSNCHTHLKRTASADPCKASFCGQLWGFLHRRETNSSHCLTFHKVRNHRTEFLISFRLGLWVDSLQSGINVMICHYVANMNLPHNESTNEALGLKGWPSLGQK